MTTKQYLGQVRRIDEKIKDKIREAQNWREIAENPGSLGLKEVVVQTSGSGDRLGEAMALSLTYQQEAEELAVEMTRLKHFIIRQIDGLDDYKLASILKEYYINNRTVSEISNIKSYELRYTKRLLKNARDLFERVYGEEYNTHETPQNHLQKG